MMNKSLLTLALVAFASCQSVSAQSTGVSDNSMSSTASAGGQAGANGGQVSTSTGTMETTPLAGQAGTGSNNQPQTFCQKYAATLPGGDTKENEQALITLVVTRAALGNQTATNPAVPGLFNPSGPTYPFFVADSNHQYRTNAPNYVTSQQQYGNNNATSQWGMLATKLVGYFGYGLGCTQAFPSYNGYNNMTAVHQNMAITYPIMQYFDEQVALSMLSYGVSMDDINNVAVPYLNSFNRYPSLHNGQVFPEGSYDGSQMAGYPKTEDEICKDASCPVAPPAYSFCEKYTTALVGPANSTNEAAFVTAFVTRAVLGGSGNGVTVQGIATPTSPLLPYFNSSIQYRTNAPNYIASYVQHGADPNYDFGKLATQLVQYFGTAVLGCREFPSELSYTGPNMQTVHAGMQIGMDEENYFVTQLANAALSFGASAQDVGFVGTAMKSFLRGSNENSVCNQQDCPCQPGLTATADGKCTGTTTGLTPGGTTPGSNNGGTTGGNNGNNNGGSSNGAAMISPSMGGLIAAAATAVVALLL